MKQTRPVLMDSVLGESLLNNYGIGDQATEPDMFGIEIELEGIEVITQKTGITKYWTQHHDNSLRVHKPNAQATEYVFSKPLNLKDTDKAVKALTEYLTETPGVEVFPSYRTSVHVHVNCMSETMRTIVNFITLSIIFDELFVSQNGETRIGNNFCLRSRDAEGQVTDLCHTIQNYGTVFNMQAGHRYSSVNIGSLMKFGTVEFRSLECTASYDRIMHWVKTVQALKEAAREYADPRQIISKFSKRGPLGFMVSVLKDQYPKYAGVRDAHSMLRDGMRLAQDFAFCTDWRPPSDEEERRGARTTKGPPKPKKAMVHPYDPAAWGQPAQGLQGNPFYIQPLGQQPPEVADPNAPVGVGWAMPVHEYD